MLVLTVPFGHGNAVFLQDSWFSCPLVFCPHVRREISPPQAFTPYHGGEFPNALRYSEDNYPNFCTF
jgi:hypothetical protein